MKTNSIMGLSIGLNCTPFIITEMSGNHNQSESAFSPKTLEIVDKTNKSVIVVRNHRFSGVHARSFFFALIPRLREIKILYRLYMDLMQIFYSSKARARKGRYDEKFFDSQNS